MNSSTVLAASGTESVSCDPVVLRLAEVAAGYGKKTVLDGLSLDVLRGCVTVLIGTNGAGKSTVLKVMMGLLPPSRGGVIWDGRDITEHSAASRARSGIGYLAQGGPVFPSLTIAENLAIGLQTTARALRQEVAARTATLFPALAERSALRAGVLSGGERRSLALAMLLCQSPRVLLLDEPSAGLAPVTARAMLAAVRRMHREFGITVVLVEQRVQEALAIADHAVALRNGAIVAESSAPMEWMEVGRMEKLLLARARGTDR